MHLRLILFEHTDSRNAKLCDFISKSNYEKVSYIYPTWNICMCYLEEAGNNPSVSPLMFVDWVDFGVNLKVREKLLLEQQVKSGIPFLSSNENHNTSTPDL